MGLELRFCSPEDAEIRPLIDALSAHLQLVTGRSGRSHFQPSDVRGAGGCFLGAFEDGKAVACGGLRRADEDSAEIKRFYVAKQRQGIGTRLMESLEDAGQRMGYKRLIVETGTANAGARTFYERLGFRVIPNYGVYVGRDNSVCFSKELNA